MKFKIDNERRVFLTPRAVLGREVENAHLADVAIRLSLAVWADSEEAKTIAEEVLRNCHAHGRPISAMARILIEEAIAARTKKAKKQ